MKIGFLAQPTDEVPSLAGSSISLWIQEVGKRLATEHEVVVYSRRSRVYPDQDEHDGVRHVRLSTDADERTIERIRRAERWLRRLLRRGVDLFHRYYYFDPPYYSHYVRAACRQAVEDGVDAIVVSNYSQFLPPFRNGNARLRTALMMQCDWMIELPRRVAQRRGSCADIIMGCSDYIVDGIRRRLPALSDRCHTLYNGSSEQALRRDAAASGESGEFQVPPDERTVLFVGRITPEKGLHVLLDAMGPLLERCPNTVLVLAGGFYLNPPRPKGAEKREAAAWEYLKADYEERLRRQAARYGDRVRFIGHVPHHKLWALYRSCDVFVHPSLWNEPFGMILTEAMLCERPVVSTSRGGIPEIVVDGETGRLVAAGDSMALATAIADLLENDAVREAMGRAGRRRVESNFTWDHTASRLNALLVETFGGA